LVTDDDAMPDLRMRLSASPPRRVFAVAVFYLLGALLIWLALMQPPAPAFLIMLVVMGAGALWLGERLRRVTALSFELGPEGLVDSAGRVLARWEDMLAVERGTFAVRPTNGFVLRLRERAPFGWAPGMWWRIGRRLGVGGVTARRETAAMAEVIAARIPL